MRELTERELDKVAAGGAPTGEGLITGETNAGDHFGTGLNNFPFKDKGLGTLTTPGKPN
jgi:hypothetical protein